MADNQINVEIKATVSDLQDAMKQAGQAVQALGEAMAGATSPASTFGDTLKKVGEIAAGLFTGEALVKAVEKIGEELRSVTTDAFAWGEALTNLSTRTGISIGHLQELQFAAKATGVEFEGLVQFSGRLSRALLELQTGTSKRLESVMATAGLKPADLEDTYGAILKVSDAINRMGEGSAESRALLTELGGRGALALEPLIANAHRFTEEAREMGLVLNNEMVAQLKSAKEEFNILGAVIDVDKERIAAALVPAFHAFAEILTEVADRLNEVLQKGDMTSWSVSIANGMFTAAESALDLTQSINALSHGALQGARALEVFYDASTGLFKSAAAASKAWLTDTTTSFDAGIAHMKAKLEEARAAVNATFAKGTIGGMPMSITGGDLTGGGQGFAGAGSGKGGGAADITTQLADQFRAFVAEQNLEIAQAGSTVQAKLAALQREAVEAATLFGQTSLQYVEAKTRELTESNRIADAQIAANKRMAEEVAKQDEEITKIFQKATEDQAKAAAKAAEDINKTFTSILEPISSGFDTMFNGIISGTQKLSEVFRRMAADMVLSFAKSGIRDLLLGGKEGSFGASIFGEMNKGGGIAGMLAKLFGGLGGGAGAAGGAAGAAAGAAGSATMFAGLKTAFSGVLTSMTGLATTWVNSVGTVFQGLVNVFSSIGKAIVSVFSQAIPAAAALLNPLQIAMKKTILEDAAVSAAEAFKGAMTTIPFPANLAAAPALATTTFAQVAAYAAFERGGISPGGLSLLHPGEMVLDRRLSDFVQRGATGGPSSGSSSSSAQQGGQMPNVTINYGPISAIDARGMREVLRQHQDTIAEIVTGHLIRYGSAYRGRVG